MQFWLILFWGGGGGEGGGGGVVEDFIKTEGETRRADFGELRCEKNKRDAFESDGNPQVSRRR